MERNHNLNKTPAWSLQKHLEMEICGQVGQNRYKQEEIEEKYQIGIREKISHIWSENNNVENIKKNKIM